MYKTDNQLQHDVIAELDWEPSVDATDIGVAVHEGVVTLSGFVKSYPEKKAAEKATRRVAGVKAIAEEIGVRLASDPKTADHEIAKRIVDIFHWNVLIPSDEITIKVEHGLVTLSGTVEWSYQRDEARNAAGRINGVIGISNLIEISQASANVDIKERITAAFKRQAIFDTGAISVSTKGGTVYLGGRVSHWSARGIAERAAWAAPGVTEVRDDIIVAV
ncbi:MAG: BON domain-containing protein [Candidatus Sphingomonas colombiensis]|nr:BON domain-containing protein [Sphingomonas sp.]WEK43204.1 MAG: BON domain-containing protein [Sphingomonas sp.]